MTDHPRERPAGVDDPALVPDRYVLRWDDDDRAYLACREAPTVRVVVEEGSVAASAARSAPEGTIFLDGAAQGPPFMDREREVHNLDHHEGCVRSFTLAACEQALVLVLKGFDLRDREWTVRANEPDLDTVLAIWVLLNHMRLASSPELRRRMIPLIRLEGVIDAHGFELQELAGFPDDLQQETLATLDSLHELELSLTRSGARAKTDRMDRTAALLRAVDALVYSPEDFDLERAEVDELVREELPGGDLVIACRSEESIYRVEQTLRWLYGDRLGVIVLQKDETTVTVRQVDAFLPATLDAVYAELNLIDPAAGPRSSSGRWGGSAEIGGSPRGKGTRLDAREIVRAVSRAFRPRTLAERATAVGRGVGAAVAGLAAAWGTNRLGVASGPLLAAAAALAVALIGLALVRAHRRPGLYGLRAPSGAGWWLLLPGALVGGLLGGAWAPAALLDGPPQLALAMATGEDTRARFWSLVLTGILLPLASELLLRGLAQGELSRAFRLRPEAELRLPRPAAVLGALLHGVTPLALFGLLWRLPVQEPVGLVLALVGALLFGLAAGMARDLSESLLPPLLFHWVAAGALVLAAVVL